MPCSPRCPQVPSSLCVCLAVAAALHAADLEMVGQRAAGCLVTTCIPSLGFCRSSARCERQFALRLADVESKQGGETHSERTRSPRVLAWCSEATSCFGSHRWAQLQWVLVASCHPARLESSSAFGVRVLVPPGDVVMGESSIVGTGSRWH